ncbi:hypothetical protein JCM10212_006542 [Sporobolomyces blumeae]
MQPAQGHPHVDVALPAHYPRLDRLPHPESATLAARRDFASSLTRDDVVDHAYVQELERRNRETQYAYVKALERIAEVEREARDARAAAARNKAKSEVLKGEDDGPVRKKVKTYAALKANRSLEEWQAIGVDRINEELELAKPSIADLHKILEHLDVSPARLRTETDNWKKVSKGKLAVEFANALGQRKE